MIRNALALGLLAALLLSGMAYLAPRAAAEDNFATVSATVEPSHNALAPVNYFSPGDDIRVDLTGTNPPGDGVPDVFDIGLFRGAGRTQSDLMILANDVALVNGRAVAVFPGSSTELLDDGWYQIDACASDYNLNYNCAGTSHKLSNAPPLVYIQLYTVSVTTDRDAYIPGETVTAYWKALYIKNGTPANGFSGGVYFYEGATTRQFGTSVSQAVGNVTFSIPTGANTAVNHSATFTWSGSDPGARSGTSTRAVIVGNMVMSLSVTPAPGYFSIAAGSPFTTTIQTCVNSCFYPLPGAAVNVSFYLDNPAPVADTYYSDLQWGLTTDSAGRASLALMATNHFVAGNTYGVVANATKVLKQASAVVTFTVAQPQYPITVTLTLDGSRYLAGSVATASAIAQESPGRGAPTSYVFTETIRDTSGNTVVRRETIQTTGVVSYQLPFNFDGSILVSVAVYNAIGDYGSASISASVVSTELILNVDPQIYRAGDTIHVSYASGLSSPNYLYTVTSGTYALLQGNTTATSFSFDIPASPASSYTIYVQATGGGRTASNSLAIYLRSGFAVHVSWDKASYNPGDVAMVTVRTEAFGSSKLPDAFRVVICLPSCSNAQTFYTSKAEDTFAYHIDAAADSGDLPGAVSVYSTSGGLLASDTEIVSVRAGGNPLWFSRLADMPLMEWILLGLVIVLFVLFFLRGGFGGGLMHLGRGPKPSIPKVAPPARESPPPPGAGLVTCASCGSPIDVTTSRRPVDVICPHCGETTTVGQDVPSGGPEPPARAGRAPP